MGNLAAKRGITGDVQCPETGFHFYSTLPGGDGLVKMCHVIVQLHKWSSKSYSCIKHFLPNRRKEITCETDIMKQQSIYTSRATSHRSCHIQLKFGFHSNISVQLNAPFSPVTVLLPIFSVCCWAGNEQLAHVAHQGRGLQQALKGHLAGFAKSILCWLNVCRNAMLNRSV